MKNDISHVIDRTALLENILNQVIERYFLPPAKSRLLFWNVLLDTSVITLGAKIKVATAIAQELSIKLTADNLHKCISYRNAFAHHATDAHPIGYVGKTKEEDVLHYHLQILSSSGKLRTMRRDDALTEFDKNYEVAKSELIQLNEHIQNNA
jgi:hypothetical protein